MKILKTDIMCLCVLLLLVAALPALAGPRGVPGGVSVVSAGPAFSSRQQIAVLARVGESASLRCRVQRLADRTVSWVRSSDLQILTHAGFVFTADTRVSCSEAPTGPDTPDRDDTEPDADMYAADDILTSRDDSWQSGSVHMLRIERLRESDSGRYECQINTEPKLSLFFNLTVVAESSLPVLTVRSVGSSGVVWGTPGGAAQLACEARYEAARGTDLQSEIIAALPPLRIRWLHDGETLDPQSPRGGISLDTERWAARVVSRLTLAQLSRQDAGRYTCTADERSATLLLRLHGVDDQGDYEVLEGEMEPMQRDQAVARVSAAWKPSASLSWIALLLPLFLT